MTKEEKKEIIQNAAKESLEKLAEIRDILEEAEAETEYSFSYKIKQQIEESKYVGDTLANNLLDMLDEDSDEYQEMEEELMEEESDE